MRAAAGRASEDSARHASSAHASSAHDSARHDSSAHDSARHDSSAHDSARHDSARHDRSGQDSETRALEAALTAEQAAIYGYGVVGAHLGAAAQAAARSDWTAHQEAADRLMSELRSRGATPAPPAVAYQLPHRVSTARQAIALAELLEERVASAYLGLVALPGADLRMLGARQVRAAALRAAAWRGTTTAFPGLTVTELDRAAGRRG